MDSLLFAGTRQRNELAKFHLHKLRCMGSRIAKIKYDIEKTIYNTLTLSIITFEYEGMQDFLLIVFAMNLCIQKEGEIIAKFIINSFVTAR